jgi:hypothetical protein
LIGKNFSTDSVTALSFLKNSSLLADHNADSNTFLFNVIPNTYSFYWSTPIEKIFDKISAESKKFWDENNRTQKANNLGLTPLQVYTIASIVEEETNKEEDKGNIASVYIHELQAFFTHFKSAIYLDGGNNSEFNYDILTNGPPEITGNTALENEVAEIQVYITALKSFFNTFKENIYLSDANGAEIDYSKLT